MKKGLIHMNMSIDLLTRTSMARWKKRVAFGTFSFVLESPKNAGVTGMGWDVQVVDQTSKAGLFLRLSQSTWKKLRVSRDAGASQNRKLHFL